MTVMLLRVEAKPRPLNFGQVYIPTNDAEDVEVQNVYLTIDDIEKCVIQRRGYGISTQRLGKVLYTQAVESLDWENKMIESKIRIYPWYK